MWDWDSSREDQGCSNRASRVAVGSMLPLGISQQNRRNRRAHDPPSYLPSFAVSRSQNAVWCAVQLFSCSSDSRTLSSSFFFSLSTSGKERSSSSRVEI